MNPEEYRQHADHCREAAERATEPIRGDFLAAASIWDMLAEQWEWLRPAAPRSRSAVARHAASSKRFFARD